MKGTWEQQMCASLSPVEVGNRWLMLTLIEYVVDVSVLWQKGRILERMRRIHNADDAITLYVQNALYETKVCWSINAKLLNSQSISGCVVTPVAALVRSMIDLIIF